jgi:hypothetical protein
MNEKEMRMQAWYDANFELMLAAERLEAARYALYRAERAHKHAQDEVTITAKMAGIIPFEGEACLHGTCGCTRDPNW